MANSFFKFKKFTINQDKCAMKVGTDGVLLGAWTNFDQAKDILDVGTGTGLIALMAAQRNSKADITAIDIEPSAIAQAQKNIALSEYSSAITIKETSLHDFVISSDQYFDVIVSNPPFFVDSLLSPDKSRNFARHANSLTMEDLLTDTKRILRKGGILSLIFPFDQLQDVKNIARTYDWNISRETTVFPLKHKKPKRVLMELTLTKIENKITHSIVIENDRHVYSEEFIALTRNFYLKL